MLLSPEGQATSQRQETGRGRMSMTSNKPCFTLLPIGGLAGLAMALVAFGQSQQQEPTWKWPESRVFETVNRVRAGRDLTPKRWPNGAHVAVGLSFDFDNETPSLSHRRFGGDGRR